MMMRARTTLALLGLAVGGFAADPIIQECTFSGDSSFCFGINIPANTASSGSGDVFFQIRAPTSYSWVSIGQGSQMSGANMFILYTDSTGKNVTLSPRSSSGHSMPQYNSQASVTLLEGSGVSGGIMTANFKCSSCSTWSGGSVDWSKSSANFIWGVRSGSSLQTNSMSAGIAMHDSASGFQLPLANAKGGSSVNPFAGVTGTTGAGGSSCIPRPTGSAASATGSGTATTTGHYGYITRTGDWESQPTGDSDDPWKRAATSSLPYCDSTTSTGSGLTVINTTPGNLRTILIAHGVMACLAFAVLFPAGAISIRVLSFPGLVWFHAGVQVLSYLVYVAAFGLGIWMANDLNYYDRYHVVIGIILFVLLFLQPIFGFLHHVLFKRYQRRTFWSYIHLWLGRILITLGIINGGLGFLLANNTKKGAIVYGIVAAIIWVLYVAAAIYGEIKRAKNRQAPPKYEDHQMSPVSFNARSPVAEEGFPPIPQPADHGYYAPHRRAL